MTSSKKEVLVKDCHLFKIKISIADNEKFKILKPNLKFNFRFKSE